MAKTYISVLKLLHQSATAFKDIDLYLNHPSTHQTQACSPLFDIVDTGTQLSVTVRDDAIFSSRGVQFNLPYILEFEYLKTATLDLNTEEETLLHNMLIAQTIGYVCLLYDEDESISAITMCEDRVQEALAEFTYELDLDAHPEELSEIMSSIYTENFKPLERGTKPHLKKHIDLSIPAPLSSFCAYQIVNAVSSDSYNSSARRASKFQWVAPLLIVFSLLEHEHDAFASYTYAQCRAYEREVYIAHGGEHVLEADADGIRPNPFTYGLVVKYTVPTNPTSDRCFMGRVSQWVLAQMRASFAKNNNIIISIDDISRYHGAYGTSIDVALDSSRIIWE